MQETNIFKRFARKGQCFTTTKRVEELLPDDIEIIPDIEKNGYNFTDGCGLMSQEYAEYLWFNHGYSPISALQIRLKGAKGMVVVTPFAAKKILLRQS